MRLYRLVLIFLDRRSERKYLFFMNRSSTAKLLGC